MSFVLFVRRSRSALLLASLALLSILIASGCGTGPASAAAPPSTPPPADNSPVVSFAASKTSVLAGDFVTLTWTATNATSVAISPNINDDDDGANLPLSGNRSFPIQTTTQFTLTATGAGGTKSTTVTVNVTPVAPKVTLTADRTSILTGEKVQLSWSAENADKVVIDNGVGELAGKGGAVDVSPATTTTYTITGSGAGGTTTASVTITVAPPAEVAMSLSASVTTITSGGKTTLTWAAQNATSVTISPALGAVSLTGSVDVTPTVTTTYTATATGFGGKQATATVTVTVLPATAGIENIKHIVLFVQENRSFDHYFGMLGKYRESKGLPNEIDGLDLTKELKTFSGKTVKPFHLRTVLTDIMSPSWGESHFYTGRNDATGEMAMNNWMMQERCSIFVANDPDCTRTMGYYTEADIPFYYEVATQFATSDRFFSSAMSGTIVNRSFLMGATSGGINDPSDPFKTDAPTIFRRLSEAGISWAYYYQDNSVFLASYSCGGACDWDKYMGNVRPIQQYYQILSSPTADRDLPQVVFIEHAAQLRLDEHTGNNVQLGVARSREIVNALINSTAWASSVMFVTHDEGGGMYDHVPPFSVVNPDGIAPMLDKGDPSANNSPWDNFTYSGFRVPLMVISPWVKPHFVSHKNREFTSFHKFIETRFGLAPLTERDKAADDMLEFFDFSKPSWSSPPPLPDQPTNGVEDQTLEKYPG